MRTDVMGDALEAVARVDPRRVCVVHRRQEFTFAEAAELVDRLSSALSGAGVSRGDRVALLLPNSPTFVWSFMAGLRAGAVLVPLNPRSRGPEISFALEDSDAVLLIAAEEQLPALRNLPAVPPRLKTVIVAAPDRAETAGCHAPYGTGPIPAGPEVIDLSALLRTPSTSPGAPAVLPGDDAIIFYTSGTTGRPKGVVCTHANCLAAVDAWIEALGIDGGSRLAMLTPFFHNAYNAFVYSLQRAGGTSIVVDSRLMRGILGELTDSRPTHLFGTPSHYLALLESFDPAHHDLSSVGRMIYGAAPMPRETIARLRATFGCDLVNAYAQSETCPAISFLEAARAIDKAPSVGRTVRCVDLAILDDAGRPVGPGAVGEICCRGPNIMRAYHKMPEATAQALRGGWLHTGDLGRLDPDGFLYLVDRRDDLVISAGENIYPKEVEDVLHSHPAVLEAAVVGIPDRVRGQVLAAFVVVRSGMVISPDDLRRHCRNQISDFKVPRTLEFLAEMPRNASGKVLKHELRARFQPPESSGGSPPAGSEEPPR